MQQSSGRALLLLGVVLALTGGMKAQAQDFLSYSSSSTHNSLIETNDNEGSSMAEAPTPQYGGGQYPQSKDRFDKLSFELGGGFNAPIGNDIPYITWGGNFTLGVGRQFTPHVGALVEYQFIDDKLPGAFLWAVGTPGGNTHIWSFTVDPIIYLHPVNQKGWNAYAVGGGGFYRKVTNFNTSVPVVYCGYFGFCVGGYENTTVASFSSNQGGANIGFGFTHSIGEGRAKYFAEARYLWVDSPGSSSTEVGTGTTGLFPVTLGVRW